jgi:hypothetical protein
MIMKPIELSSSAHKCLRELIPRLIPPLLRPSLPSPRPPTQVMYKAGKLFTSRQMEACAANCESIRAEVDAFKKFVPLVQVRGVFFPRSIRLLFSPLLSSGASHTAFLSSTHALVTNHPFSTSLTPHTHARFPPTPTPPCAQPTLHPQALRNPGMRERHWNQLSTDLGMSLHPEKSFTLKKAEEMGLLEHLEIITKVRQGRRLGAP